MAGTSWDWIMTLLSFEIHKCTGSNCKSEDEINRFISQMQVSVFVEEYVFDPKIHNAEPLFRNDRLLSNSVLNPSELVMNHQFIEKNEKQIDDRWLQLTPFESHF